MVIIANRNQGYTSYM